FREPSRAYTILLYSFGGIFIMSYIWSWALGSGIQLQRTPRSTWAQVGRHMHEDLSLVNTSVFPAPQIELIDHSTLPGFDAGHTAAVNAEGAEPWTASAFCT